MNQNQGNDYVELGPIGEEAHRPRAQSQPQRIEILYEEYLPPEYSRRQLPTELAQKRNLAIKALFVQIISSVTGLLCFMFRRVVLYLLLNFLSIGLVVIAIDGVLKLDKWRMSAHSLVTMGVLGTSGVYFLLEALFLRTTREITGDEGTSRMSERAILFLLTMPYLVDLACGVITFSLTISIFKLEEAKEKHSQSEADLFKIKSGQIDPDSENCVICLSFKKNCCMYPCGHRVLCNLCSKLFRDKRQTTCPICRKPVRDIIQVYE